MNAARKADRRTCRSSLRALYTGCFGRSEIIVVAVLQEADIALT
jgi:hypothetical protein